MRTTVIGNVSEWRALEPHWRALHAVSPTASPTNGWDWLDGWLRVYGDACLQPDALRVVAVWDGDALAGALPLYRGAGGALAVRRLLLLSTGEDEAEETDADYLDMLHLPDLADAVGAAALQALLALDDWDVLDITQVAADSALAGCVDLWGAAGLSVEREPLGECPRIDLSRGFDAWLADLPARRRRPYRRALREMEEHGAAFELATPATLDAVFDELIALHQRRWTADGRPGCFAAPRFTQFQRDLAQRQVATGEALLARLAIDGRPLALTYGFVCRGEFHHYLSGRDVDGEQPLQSPGNALTLSLMQWLCDHGMHTYDFLKGTARYKMEFATHTREMVRLRVSRPTVRASLAGAARSAKQAVRGVVRR